ncbi:16S rRNA (uracil(1498)-N(3))-methyltransferase [Prosthecochloris sp. ZM_2]|uniref:RsmE family RNA methyltransferase n=1 Tax=Prosthecochloris sp. ZM_2 TaxID=2045206 RepID=UPI000DF7C777|nr:RsmE family RNA methyltransferase [Prosthecochloris sp. ZM_2]RNA65510.1 16S rRNA (uracil(1498)-N(3))-methyltransferase [Prosthecochloris sp. ZM_2]
MDLFYTSPDCIDEELGELVVEGEEFHHIVRVLRRSVGDTIYVTDGRGLCARAAIRSVDKRRLRAEMLSCERLQPPPARLTIAMSLLKSPQRFDFFLEKATELGVDRIVPMVSSRTVSRARGDKARRKTERWRNLLVSASRQTKRFYLPLITEPVSFQEVLAMEAEHDVACIAHESSLEVPCGEMSGSNVLFLVGPEGGFSSTEVGQALEAGFQAVSLGPSILRAETAALCAAAFVRMGRLGTTGCGETSMKR